MSVIKYLDTTIIGASSETDIDTTWSIKRGASTGTAFTGESSNWQGTSDSTGYPPLVIDATDDNTAHNNMPPYLPFIIMEASSSATLTTQEVQSKLEAL